jgi:hypothetical protein
MNVLKYVGKIFRMHIFENILAKYVPIFIFQRQI